MLFKNSPKVDVGLAHKQKYDFRIIITQIIAPKTPVSPIIFAAKNFRDSVKILSVISL